MQTRQADPRTCPTSLGPMRERNSELLYFDHCFVFVQNLIFVLKMFKICGRTPGGAASKLTEYFRLRRRSASYKGLLALLFILPLLQLGSLTTFLSCVTPARKRHGRQHGTEGGHPSWFCSC
jgi:hypothetical protein